MPKPESPFTHVLVRTLFDQETSKWYWRREGWFNDPVIGAQPPDVTVDSKRRYVSQRIAMRQGLNAASQAV